MHRLLTYPFPTFGLGRSLGWRFALAPLALLLLFVSRASAQWASESYPLVAGWNAIWLPIDCSDRTIGAIFNGTQVVEVWQWNPTPSGGFTVSPSTPTQANVEWRQWTQGAGGATLGALTGNAAYLIHVADSAAQFTLTLTGKPLPPSLPWNNSGVNLVGFPTVSSGPPHFYDFLKLSNVLQGNPAIFQYVGGALSSTAPKNPNLVSQPATTLINRNQAYWVQSTTYTSYYGPLAVTVSGQQMLDFGTSSANLTIQIKNVTDPAQGKSIVATLTPAASVAPPPGQAAVAGAVPLMVQSALNPTTGGFTYSPLTSSYSTVSLAPGQFVNVVLAVDRSSLAGAAGAVSQSLLKITDSLGYTSVNLGVRATTSSFDGVWTGTATVTNVDEVLSAQSVVNGNPITDANGQPVAAVATNPVTGVTSPFAVKLVLFAGGGGSQLLQQVFIVNDANNVPHATKTEAGINAISVAAGSVPGRLSTAFFPPGPQGQPGVYGPGGPFSLNGSLTYNVPLLAGASTNPFLHEYHPDHGPTNSYAVNRAVTLTFQPTLTGVSDTDPNWGSTTLGGAYQETVTGLRAAANGGGVKVSGTFVLHRVNSASTLQP